MTRCTCPPTQAAPRPLGDDRQSAAFSERWRSPVDPCSRSSTAIAPSRRSGSSRRRGRDVDRPVGGLAVTGLDDDGVDQDHRASVLSGWFAAKCWVIGNFRCRGAFVRCESTSEVHYGETGTADTGCRVERQRTRDAATLDPTAFVGSGAGVAVADRAGLRRGSYQYRGGGGRARPPCHGVEIAELE